MLKKYILLLTLSILLTLQPSYAVNSQPSPLAKIKQPQPVPVPTSQIQVYFSPNGNCTDAIVKALNQAKSSILIQAYSFASPPIAKAVVEAHKRGVKVQVILDKSQRTEKYSSADFVAHAGIKVLIDAKHKIAHNKIMVIDTETVITGSFNFTKFAEEGNAENLLIINSPELAAKYIENWNKHSEHSEEYKGR